MFFDWNIINTNITLETATSYTFNNNLMVTMKIMMMWKFWYFSYEKFIKRYPLFNGQNNWNSKKKIISFSLHLLWIWNFIKSSRKERVGFYLLTNISCVNRRNTPKKVLIGLPCMTRKKKKRYRILQNSIGSVGHHFLWIQICHQLLHHLHKHSKNLIFKEREERRRITIINNNFLNYLNLSLIVNVHTFASVKSVYVRGFLNFLMMLV